MPSRLPLGRSRAAGPPAACRRRQPRVDARVRRDAARRSRRRARARGRSACPRRAPRGSESLPTRSGGRRRVLERVRLTRRGDPTRTRRRRVAARTSGRATGGSRSACRHPRAPRSRPSRHRSRRCSRSVQSYSRCTSPTQRLPVGQPVDHDTLARREPSLARELEVARRSGTRRGSRGGSSLSVDAPVERVAPFGRAPVAAGSAWDRSGSRPSATG